MAEPFSIAAGVVGVAVPALQGLKFLLDDLQKLKDAPKTVRRLEEDVRSVELALSTLQAVEDREWQSLGMTIAEESKATISTCTKACDQFRANLQHWTRHSEDGKLALKDRASVGFFKQGQIKAMSAQLGNCKLTVNSVVSIATFSIRHTRITEEIKKTISTKQSEIVSAITRADKQLIILENNLEELSLSNSGEDPEEAAAESTQSKTEALQQQFEEERRALNASRKVLEELLSKSTEEAIAKATAAKNHSHYSATSTTTFGNLNSGFQARSIHGAVSGLTFGGK
ncbi:MAG: hypothetical protein Q9212_004239 [Teloschistes hypoglaucus]